MKEQGDSGMTDRLQKRYPQNRIFADESGKESVMVYIPKFSMSDLIDGAEDTPHPAFIVDGKVLNGIYISKFQNVIVEGHACSLPDADPATEIDFDEAWQASAIKGAGWHLMTAMEWGAIALWCRKNKRMPYGNTDLGKDVREDGYVAQISYRNEEKGICRVATGTGPVTWSHDRRADGIWDLNGNVWEWNGGIRLVRGELQLLPDNNGACNAYSQTSTSGAWRAIDGETGEYILPNGAGTTKNSVKLDMIDGAFTYVIGEVRDRYPHARFCDFSAVHAEKGVCEKARLILSALGILPVGDPADYAGISFYVNNGSDERMSFRGGRYGQGMNTGVFKTCIDDLRTYRGEGVGFRAAFYELP